MKIIKYNTKDLRFKLPDDFFQGVKVTGDKAKYWFNQYNRLLDDYKNLKKKYNELKDAT